MGLDFKVGDKVSWPEFRDDYDELIPEGSGTIVTILEDGDNMDYEVRSEDGEIWYPFNHLITRINNPMSVKSLNGQDIGKVVRVPTASGLVVQGTLMKVHHDFNRVTIKFSESDNLYYADMEGVFEYV